MRHNQFNIENVNIENRVVGFCNEKTIVIDEMGRWFYTYSQDGDVHLGEQVFQADLKPIELLSNKEQFIIRETLKEFN